MISEHFSRFLAKHHRIKNRALERLFHRVSEAVQTGSSCLNFNEVIEESGKSLQQWLELLIPGEADSVVGFENDFTPLVLTENKLLYLRRYFDHEKNVVQLLQRHILPNSTPLPSKTKDLLEQLFPPLRGKDTEDLQRKAAEIALKHKLSIISGGPGTGKTTTVVKILALLKTAELYLKPEHVLLIAPTGKAADRLRQSIQQGISALIEKMPEYSLEFCNLPTETATIHRALGYLPNRIDFKHNKSNPLPHQLIIVDETSMVDLPLMSRLLSAISADSHLILLGDKNQLSSVAVGTILADLSEASEDVFSPLHHCCVTLTKTYRNSGAIKSTCDAIRDGNSSLAYRRIRQTTTTETSKSGSTQLEDLPPVSLRDSLLPLVEKYWLPTFTHSSLTIQEKLNQLDHFKVLSPLNKGRLSVETINATVESILNQFGVPTQDEWYEGKPIIVLENDPNLGIYNGDVGLLTKTDKGEIKAAFRRQNEIIYYPISQLPEVNSAWALTIHKTQGSEYENLLLILPESDNSQLKLTRELVYTGLSRAKCHAIVWSSKTTFQTAIEQKIERASGLVSQFTKLRNAGATDY